MNKAFAFFACYLLLGTSTIAQINPKGYEASLVIENPQTPERANATGIFYTGDPIRLKWVFNESKWDGSSSYFVYVIKMFDDKLDILYPKEGGIYTSTPVPLPEKTNKGKLLSEMIIFNGIAEKQPGKQTYFLLMTEKPIKDYASLIRNKKNKEFDVKEECLKLIKGSKLSYFYDPGSGNSIVQTIQTEIRPAADKMGLMQAAGFTETAPVKKKIFVFNDSAEIFYTPYAQEDIVRDSFPTIDILDPQLNTAPQKGLQVLARADGKKVMVRGIAVDRLQGIRSLTVDGIAPQTFREASGYFDYMYELKNGVNTTDITVENNRGYKRMIRLKFQYTPKTGEITQESRDWLLVIGIDSYKNLQELNNATRDAKDFEQLMMEQYGYKKENIVELFDASATRKNIFAQFRKFIDNLSKNDRLLIYYSGHGWYDDKLDLGYWLPVNAAMNEYDEFLGNLDITRYIQKMNAKNIFVIADACYSGSLLRDMQKENSRDFKSRMLLCSGKLKPVPDGIAGNNSPFAEKVLNFFKTNTGNQVSASDLIQYVKKAFPPSSSQQPVGGAVDEVGDENGDFIFKRKKL